MDSGIIIALILGGASIVSSICFGLIPSIRKEKLDKMQTKVNKMIKDIHFFYNLEQNYIQELSEMTGKNKETIKKDKRTQIEKTVGYSLSQYAKPSVTKKEIINK
ncbi:MAG: hypothetical protein J5606_08405 [Bacteroidales bacterium]|nr:hypothetical protein [Bacteroidales bacterium]